MSKQTVSISVFAIAAGIFCLYANMFSLILNMPKLAYFRDAIVTLILVIGVYRRNSFLGVIAICMSSLILIFSVVKGFSPFLLPEIRNYVAFPVLFICVVLAEDIKTEASPDLQANYVWLNAIFALLIISFAIEAGLYLAMPEVQTLAYGLLAHLTKEKGVSVGLGGGLIHGGRILTPLLNPVQGAFALYLAYHYKRPVRPRDHGAFYISHLATLSKITLFGALLERARKASPAVILPFIFISIIGVIAALTQLPARFTSVNLSSMALHFEGGLYGILSSLNRPLGIPFRQVGALSGRYASRGARPGFESFLGSFFASFGVIGVLGLVAYCLPLAAKRPFLRILLILLLFSDNISSPALYIVPALFVFLNP